MTAAELIQACAASDDGAVWTEFVVRFHRPIALSILRTAYQWKAAGREVVDDLVQETYLKLCANRCRLLRDFAAQHPDTVIAYVKTIAANVAHDHFKALHSQKRGAGEAAQSRDDIGPEAPGLQSGGPDAMERQVLMGEIKRALEICAGGPERARDRAIFWLYYEQGMSAEAIAALPTIGLTGKGVESAIYRLTRLVREQLAQSRSEPGAAAPPNEKGIRPAESY